MTEHGSMGQHYARSGLVMSIQSALDSCGIRIEDVTVEDLGSADEFHMGGRIATSHLVEPIELQAGQKILDIGCGIGGTGRFLADRYPVSVSGIDLSEEYIDTAKVLNDWVSLSDRISMDVGSATALPYEDEAFDVAIMLHVGMNISDKPSLFSEACRVLRPGGRFLIYDVMTLKNADIALPVPWASDATMNHMETAENYAELLRAAGFSIQRVEGRAEFAKAFFTKMQKKAASSKVRSPLGLHLLMGDDIGQKTANFAKAVFDDIVEPTEIVAVK